MDRGLRRWVRVGAVGAALAGTALLFTESPADAAKPLARAELRDAAGSRVGVVVFEGRGHHAEWVRVEVALPAGAPGVDAFHGFHIHAVGQCVVPFTSAGGHWNLTGASHGGHTGDMPSVLVGPDGVASARFETHRFDVNQLFDGDGSAVILHAGPDNFGNVPLGADRYQDPMSWYHATPAGTAFTGDAGPRYACGVVRPR